MKFGARHLKRSIERHLVFPLSNLLATSQIALGDLVTVDCDSSLARLTFVKEAQGALVYPAGEAAAAVCVTPASSGRAASVALARRAAQLTGRKQ